MWGKNETPVPSFSALLHLTVYVTLSALDFHLDGKGARSATQPGGTWTVGLGGVKAFSPSQSVVGTCLGVVCSQKGHTVLSWLADQQRHS